MYLFIIYKRLIPTQLITYLIKTYIWKKKLIINTIQINNRVLKYNVFFRLKTLP